MPLHFECPFCKTQYQVTDDQAAQYRGQTVTCSQCQKTFTVPAQPGGPAIAPPPQMGSPVVGYAGPTPYSGPMQSNGMAIAAVICGALGFVIPVLGGVLGIIFGILGIQRSRRPGVGGFTPAVVGLVLGCLSTVMVPCMVSILLPSLNRARETANRVKCASNLRQIGQAMLLYANENRGAYPPRPDDLIVTEELSPSAFVCPSTNDTIPPGSTPQQQAANVSAGGHDSYVYVAQHQNSSSPATAVLVYENPSNHSNDGCNVLFGDGHVEFISKNVAQQMISQLNAGQNPPPVFTH